MLEAALRRDRAIVGTALAALTALSWFYLVMLARAMPSMDTGALGLDAQLHAWSAGHFITMFFMWTVMMVGMMTPSVAPMILLYARVGRQARDRQTPFAAAGLFLGGYLLAWAAFSLAATLGQWGLEQALLLSPMMRSTSQAFSALVLIAGGLYQLTPAKRACLQHCQAPLAFIQRHGGFRRDPVGAMRVGIHHGLYCVGCCWALMALLFAGGVMNLLWVAAISIFVLLEKILPTQRWFPFTAGAILITGGIWLSLSALVSAHAIG